jgi:hypothetical protein
MNSDGFRTGTSLSAGLNIGIFATRLVVTGDFTQMWSSTTSVTAMTSREYDMASGDPCAPASIQFGTQCQTKIVHANNGNVAVTHDEANPMTAPIWSQTPLSAGNGYLNRFKRMRHITRSERPSNRPGLQWMSIHSEIWQPNPLRMLNRMDGYHKL